MFPVSRALCISSTASTTSTCWRGAPAATWCSPFPYRVTRERGFEARGDEPILAMVAERTLILPVEEFLALLPFTEIRLAGEPEPSLSDAEYAAMVRQFQQNEIEAGNASQATLSRRFSGRIEGFGVDVALSLYRKLLGQIGQYMTVLFVGREPADPGKRHYLAGATPERHLEITGNSTIMIPIAGTLRKQDRETFPARLARFVEDPKEVNELFQVLDEEMKMMSLICPEGGRINGPFLREIGAVVHSEYELVGKRGTNTMDALRRTLHAPTVLGSPMESAARIIAKYEPVSRRYYGGEIGIYRCPRGAESNGDLDCAILIRCAELFDDGSFSVQSGGGLVRDSVPEDEARESRAKAMGFLAVLTGPDRAEAWLTPELEAGVREVFTARNRTLAPFWMSAQARDYDTTPALRGLSATIVNNEDDFAHMIAHQLRSMGAAVTVVDTGEYDAAAHAADVPVLGPGPGDPSDMTQKVMARLQEIIAGAKAAQTPMLGVCLGHQALAVAHGLDVLRQDRSTQGLQIECRVAGDRHRLGFYNSFSPVENSRSEAMDFVLDTDGNGRIVAMRGPGFAGFQFHPESVMSQTGYDLLQRAVVELSGRSPLMK